MPACRDGFGCIGAAAPRVAHVPGRGHRDCTDTHRRQRDAAKCIKRDVTVTLQPNSAWPENTTPEKTTPWSGDPALSRLGALKAALQGERRGFEFCYAIAHTTKDPEIHAVAKEFVREEPEHVEKLKQWIELAEARVRARAAA